MQSSFEIKKIMSKFEQLKEIDEDYVVEKQKEKEKNKSFELVFKAIARDYVN